MWSTSGFFAKAPVFEQWPAESRGLLLAFWRATFAAAILATMVRKVDWSWRMLPMVVIFALMNWTYLTALVMCESTLAIWLQYTAPLWVLFFAWKLFGEAPIRKDWWLLAFVSAGMGLILLAEIGGGSLRGVLYGVASGVFFAGVVVMLRWNNAFDSAWIVFLNHVVTAIVFLPFLATSGIYPNGSQWIYLACFGALQLGLPYLLLARALREVSSHEASGLTLLEPILVPVWVWLAWSQSPSYQAPKWLTIMGAALIFSGLVIRIWPAKGPLNRKNRVTDPPLNDEPAASE